MKVEMDKDFSPGFFARFIFVIISISIMVLSVGILGSMYRP
jgi:hypothetical protein